MIIGFGVEARHYVSRIRADLPILAVSADGVSPGMIEAVRRRRVAIPTAVAPLYTDERVAFASFIGGEILSAFSGPDERWQRFTSLAAGEMVVNDRPQATLRMLDAATAHTLRDIATLGDLVIARSQRDVRRIADRFAEFTPRALPHTYAVFAPLDISVPTVHPLAGAKGVVVWAPRAPATELALIAFALDSLSIGVTLVCATGEQLPGVHARTVTPAHAHDALAAARVVVDANWYDPGAAYAFARAGTHALCVPSTSGASELLAGASIYDPVEHRSITAAVLVALGAGSPILLADPDDASAVRRALERSRPVTVTEPPLVSLVLPTYDRRGILPRVIESIVGQTYRNIELVVVNDGPPVDDLVTNVDCVRIIHREGKGGLNSAFDLGVRESNGRYVGIQPDDDPIFPDHVMRLVEALERSGSVMAHSRPIAAILEPAGDRGYDLLGYNVVYDAPVDPFDMQWHNMVANTALFRRSSFLALGGYDDLTGYISDYDLWLRLMSLGELIHVPHVTCELLMRRDETNTSNAGSAEAQRVYAVLYGKHGLVGRPMLDFRRSQYLAQLANPAGPLEPVFRLSDPSCLGYVASLR